MKKYYVYIAKCKDETLYTGYTVDLKDREDKHNSGEGAKYTRHRRPVKIVYSEEFKTMSEAMKREAEIKKLSRIDKENLIKPS
ncbi:GIY-YIG nuclease family protein [Candidatus Parcubacteria bacterium]|jgi:putative endonuclease|nr:GIY-YIG nuclease family protein [Candidatus Parcubacteria bacterium]